MRQQRRQVPDPEQGILHPPSTHARRTQPALPGAAVPTAQLVVPSQYLGTVEEPMAYKRPQVGRRILFTLFILGILLELLYLALYPLLVSAPISNDALLHLFPWLSRLTALPFLAQGSTRPAILNTANLLLLLMGLAFALSLLASRVAKRSIRERLSHVDQRRIFWAIVLFTAVFGLTFVLAPGGISQETFLYGLYGRMVAFSHVNPYVVHLSTLPPDLLSSFAPNVPPTVPYGPVWLDMSIPVVLLAHNSVANTIVGFRLLGWTAHLANVLLIWVVLSKPKPELRIPAILLYAWNPIVLLFSIGEMHFDVVVVMFLLLAIVFFQRRSPTLGWVFVLLATLVNAFCLLLLPLFFLFLIKEGRAMPWGRRLLWYCAVLGLSGLVVLLAYAPYWQGWGLTGLLTNLQQTLWQHDMLNSVDTATLHLPLQIPSALLWLIAPQHWMIVVFAVVGILLVFGFWLGDTLELVLLFSSWLFLALMVLLPIYKPEYILIPLMLAICANSRRSKLLAVLLSIGALLSFYWGLGPTAAGPPTWLGQALVTVGLPLLLWGWTMFFLSTWQMAQARAKESEQVQGYKPRRGFSRPPWISRSPRSSRNYE